METNELNELKKLFLKNLELQQEMSANMQKIVRTIDVLETRLFMEDLESSLEPEKVDIPDEGLNTADITFVPNSVVKESEIVEKVDATPVETMPVQNVTEVAEPVVAPESEVTSQSEISEQVAAENVVPEPIATEVVETVVKSDEIAEPVVAEVEQKSEPVAATEPIVASDALSSYSEMKQAQASKVLDEKSEEKKSEAEKTVATSQPKKEAESSNLEAKIGKNFMGIAASVLIFISFIFFASVVTPSLPDWAKVALMYLVSAGFTGGGFFFLRKQPTNKFFLSLASCGLGMIFLSILIHHAYFEQIPAGVVLTMLLAWVGGMSYLAKRATPNEKIFQAIGHFGILAAISYEMFNLVGEDTFIAVFYAIASTTLTITTLKTKFSDNVINLVANIITMIVMMARLVYLNDTSYGEFNTIPFALLISVVPIAYFVMAFSKYDVKENETGYTICNVITLTQLCLLPLFMSDYINRPYEHVIIAIVAALAFVFNKIKTKELKNSVLTVFDIACLGWIAFAAVEINFILFIVAASTMVGAFKLKDKSLLVYSIVFSVLTLFAYTDRSMATQAFFVIPLVGMYSFFMYKSEEFYGVSLKLFVYVLLLVSVGMAFNQIHDDHVITLSTTWNKAMLLAFVTLASILNGFFLKTKLGRNWHSGERESVCETIGYLLQIALMCTSVYLLYTTGAHAQVIAIFVAVANFCVNSSNLLDKGSDVFGIEKGMLSLYVGIKFTVLVYCILDSLAAKGFVIDIACFVAAVIFIVVGFKVKQKPLRLYALALSCISIAKLLFVDINYDNDIMKAGSYFVCGVLCFVINLVYNKIEKKLKENTEPKDK